MGGVSTKDLKNSSDDEVEVPPGSGKFHGPAPAAPAPSHSRDWGHTPQRANAPGNFSFDVESPEID